jgi:GNAT superfamily N-acetyltransferase
MSATGRVSSDGLVAEVTGRWRSLDPLLPVAAPTSREFVVSLPDGNVIAEGSCDHWEGKPGALELAWGAARRFTLTATVAGPEVGDALDRLVSLWRGHLMTLPEAAHPDTAAMLSWPSRDLDGIATLLRRGFAPLAVIAARPIRPLTTPDDPSAAHDPGAPGGSGLVGGSGAVLGLGDSGEAGGLAGVRIRRAGLRDLDAVVRLGLEVVHYDAHFGGVVVRPDSDEAMRRECAGRLAGPEPWIWLAELDGQPVGLLCAKRPEESDWIAPMVRLDPVAYLDLMSVLPSRRGTGIGAALVDRFHREVEASGVAVTLLHYAQLNPLSAPFWSRRGYRPLWSSWEVRPADRIR